MSRLFVPNSAGSAAEVRYSQVTKILWQSHATQSSLSGPF